MVPASGAKSGRIVGVAIGLAAFLVTAAAQGGPVLSSNHNRPAAHDNAKTKSSATRDERAPTIIRVEPSAQEVAAVAEQESANSRILWLTPDAWVAIFTAVLSLSTILLWLDTRKSAEAALRAALAAERALIDADRPYLLANIPKSGMNKTPTGYGFGHGAITFTNHGKTPAILKSIFRDVRAWKDWPDAIDPLVTEGQPIPDEVIGSQKTCDELPLMALPKKGISTGAIDGGTWWCVGYIKYSDLIGIDYVTGFAFILDNQDNFVIANPLGQGDKYNYTRKIEPPPAPGWSWRNMIPK